MAYDVTSESSEFSYSGPRQHRNTPTPKRDLEVLVTLLEIAALSLTDNPDSQFTKDELFKEVRGLAGGEYLVQSVDLETVIKGCSFLHKTGNGKMALR